jgi:hypothetical protein
MAPLSNDPCTDFESTVPLKVINRVIKAGQAFDQLAPPGPPWDPLAGIRLTADSSLPPSNIPAVGIGAFYYPYAPGQTPKSASFRVTLYRLDRDGRQPHASSNVQVQFGGSQFALAPSGTVTLTPGTQSGYSAFILQWLSKGPYVGYPGRFILVLDGGAQYGSMEYWLQVWNWS